jgi:hypothetical protein
VIFGNKRERRQDTFTFPVSKLEVMALPCLTIGAEWAKTPGEITSYF